MSTTTTKPIPKIVVHWLNRSRAQRILWLLEEVGLPYEVKTYQRDANMNAPPSLKAVHSLGKSPTITIDGRAIAESSFIIEYLCDHFGPHLIPTKWKPGKEGELDGETDEWMRFRYFMHYCEGSLMAMMALSLVPQMMKSSPAPFFIRPLVNRIAGGLHTAIAVPGFATHLAFLEEQLATAPGGGPYLCGTTLTAADILMSFGLLVSRRVPEMSGLTEKAYPQLWRYTTLLETGESYKRAVAKVVELEGEYVLF
ncbi:hypothetical protein C8R46DRAFT_460964 [Mycena filopes]|nr:hypothetical protein C8R46DRAFT_460964 [Mycena filopes]